MRNEGSSFFTLIFSPHMSQSMRLEVSVMEFREKYFVTYYKFSAFALLRHFFLLVPVRGSYAIRM
ncbi:MAG: hypothetical protein WBM69_07350, partial [Desulfobacterales bacterium]